MKHLLLVDNYDSFTYNLKHLVLSCPDIELTIKRNDEDVIPDIENKIYDGVIIGPGPGSPDNEDYFGVNNQIILDFGTKGLPVLGICLGFQGIYSCFGGKLKKAVVPMHGKISILDIVNKGQLFKGIDGDVSVMRYHSIMADLNQSIPDELLLTSFTENGGLSAENNGKELMSLEHKEHPIFGVQFHPESFATDQGQAIIQNFLNYC